LRRIALGRPGIHEGEGRIRLEDGTVVVAHGAGAHLPPGPCCVGETRAPATYRETAPAGDAAAGTSDAIRARANASLTLAAARAVCVVALTSAALSAAACHGLVFGDARLAKRTGAAASSPAR
jgi:hypothetical protein